MRSFFLFLLALLASPSLYALAEAGAVRVQVLDVLGRAVWQHDDTKAAGHHVLTVPTSCLPASAYLLTLSADGQTFTRRLVLR